MFVSAVSACALRLAQTWKNPDAISDMNKSNDSRVRPVLTRTSDRQSFNLSVAEWGAVACMTALKFGCEPPMNGQVKSSEDPHHVRRNVRYSCLSLHLFSMHARNGCHVVAGEAIVNAAGVPTRVRPRHSACMPDDLATWPETNPSQVRAIEILNHAIENLMAGLCHEDLRLEGSDAETLSLLKAARCLVLSDDPTDPASRRARSRLQN